MRRALLALAAILAVIAGAWLLISPPKLLSLVDGVAGGGRGAERVAKAVPFGSHGQTLDIWAPERVSGPAGARALPVVIFWYGGGWVKGDRDAYAFAGRALAKAGFVVVIPDYRKVPKVLFPDFLVDGAEAVRWTRDNIARFGGNPTRLGFAGHSAGAYEAVMLALDSRWLKAQGVDPAIVGGVVGLSGPYDFYPFDSPRSKAAFGKAPDPQLTQPIRFARDDAPPMLLVTSAGDTLVRARNANNLAARLTDLGAPVEVRNYGPLSHEEVVMALSKPFRDKAPVLGDMSAFFHAALSDRPSR